MRIAFRIYNPVEKKMIYSGSTPMMLYSFFKHTAVLNTTHGMEYQQYIGCVDKTGKYVYCGDILLTTSPMVFLATSKETGEISRQKSIVVWENAKSAFCKKENNKVSPWSISSELVKEYDVIIGNIIENPESIKELG